MSEEHFCIQEGRILSLEKWEERQNGSLQRIEKKVDQLFFATLSGMSAVVLALVGAIIGLS